MIEVRFSDGKESYPEGVTAGEVLKNHGSKDVTKKTVAAKMEELRFNEAIAAIGDCVAFGDRYVNEKKPWATQDKKAILDAVIMVDNLGALLAPFLPETAEKITKSIQWLSPNVMKVERPPILFPRL